MDRTSQEMAVVREVSVVRTIHDGRESSRHAWILANGFVRGIQKSFACDLAAFVVPCRGISTLVKIAQFDSATLDIAAQSRYSVTLLSIAIARYPS
jgi:hypothetical protein